MSGINSGLLFFRSDAFSTAILSRSSIFALADSFEDSEEAVGFFAAAPPVAAADSGTELTAAGE